MIYAGSCFRLWRCGGNAGEKAPREGRRDGGMVGEKEGRIYPPTSPWRSRSGLERRSDEEMNLSFNFTLAQQKWIGREERERENEGRIYPSTLPWCSRTGLEWRRDEETNLSINFENPGSAERDCKGGGRIEGGGGGKDKFIHQLHPRSAEMDGKGGGREEERRGSNSSFKPHPRTAEVDWKGGGRKEEGGTEKVKSVLSVEARCKGVLLVCTAEEATQG